MVAVKRMLPRKIEDTVLPRTCVRFMPERVTRQTTAPDLRRDSSSFMSESPKIVPIEIETPVPTESRKPSASRKSAFWIMQNVAARETSNVTEMKGKGARWWKKKRNGDEGQRVSDAVARSKNALKRVWSPRSSREWRNRKRSAEARNLRARAKVPTSSGDGSVLFTSDYREEERMCGWMFHRVDPAAQ